MYLDSLGIPTVGVGHNLLTPMPQSIIEALLHHDVEVARRGLRTHPKLCVVYHNLSPARRGVLENMAFNLGTEGLAKFTKMLAALEQGDWTGAAREMLDSKWALQVGARAERLAQQMERDEWQ